MELKHINITSSDLVKFLDDDMKHQLAKRCIVNKVEPEDLLTTICNVVNGVINVGIDVTNNYFKTDQGKKYLEVRNRIEELTMNEHSCYIRP